MIRAKIFLVGVLASLFFVGQAIGQGNQVTGKVISGEDREPLLGVNIVVKNTTRGTTTDQDGKYVLANLTPEDVLVFSYIGFIKQEVTVGNRQEIGVRLTPQALSGEAVVVIGYGTQQRRDITSAVSSLQDYAFTQGATTDPQNLLQARIPGVVVTQINGDVGSAPLIRIRGGTSVSAGNEPMIVIDGVPVSSGSASPGGPGTGDVIGTNPIDTPLSTLNPGDIASIDVLKDASSAAIYGARGGNGVILISTKKGRAGGFSMTYDGYTSTSSQSEKLNLMTAQEYRDFARKLGVTGDLGSASTDWQDAIVRTAISQNHNLTFSSGTEATQYLVSLNYLDEEGIVLGSERNRVSGRLNLDHSMFENKLRLGVRLNPSFIKRHNTPYPQEGGFEGGVFTNVYKMIPTQPVVLSNGGYFEYANPGIRNPVALVEQIDDETETLRLFFNGTAEYDFFSSLTGKINVGLDRTNATRSTYQPRSLPYAASFGGRADNRSNQNQNVLFEGTLNYRKNIGASQKLEAWGGYTFQEFEDQSFGVPAQGFVTDGWSFNNLGGGSDFPRPFSFQAENRLISFLGRVNYNISDKYLLSAAMRREGSSRFGVDNKWGMFPSVSGGWRLSQEPFLQNTRSLNDLKLRVSYGVTGNQDIGNFRSLLILGPGSNAVIGDQVRTGVAPTQLATPDLKWEETSQLNIGVDFGLWNDRFSGTIDWYNKKTNDLLIEFTVPQPSVVSTRLDNVGEVTNKGLEISLNTVNISSGGFFWRTNFNFATNKNKVVDLGGRASIVHGRVSGAGLSAIDAQLILPGQPLGTFFGPRFLGYNASGNEILSTDPDRPERTTGPLKDGRQILGDAQPDYTFGIANSINYRSFDFRVFIQGVQGNEILNNTRMEYQRASNVKNGINFFQDALDDVAAGLNPDATVHFSDRFIEDGSFIRLQNVTLGYTFPTSWFASLRSLRGYISADNLFVLTDYKGYDPEVNNVNVVNGVFALGIDYANYPRARTVSFGVNLGF